MVYLEDILRNKEKQVLSTENPTKWLYCYLFGIEIPDGDYRGENAISYSGYKNLNIDIAQLDNCINTNAKMNYTSSIPLFIGVHLADKEMKYADKVIQFYQTLKRNKEKYVFSLCFSFLRDIFKNEIENMNEDDKLVYKYLYNMGSGNFQINIPINEYSSDVYDLIVSKKLLEKDRMLNIYENSMKDSIIYMLQNFSNAIIKITKNRYADRAGISIEQEYDVQDILFAFFKFYFNDAIRENPLPKRAGSYSIIDICFPERKIYIEIKMLKKSDKNEKEIIEQLKKDMFDYEHKDVENLIIFVYDPFRRIQDKDNFKDFEKTRNGANYTCSVIIQN